MLSAEQNERFTRVGPGTPCGELMRRYWHPIAATAMLEEDPVQPVRILGEDLTLYRDRQDRLGPVGQRCPHRAFDLRFGIPEEEGLRCPYHGWMLTGRVRACSSRSSRRTARIRTVSRSRRTRCRRWAG